MFELDERLAADTVEIADWPMCRVLLMKDANFPWLILVPKRRGVSELHELDSSDHALLMAEVTEASRRLHYMLHADKMNVATLGNLVAQLHVHVIARFKTDPAWPKPIWGVLPAKPYEPGDLVAQVTRLKDVFATPPT